jgi:hypothetical protein
MSNRAATKIPAEARAGLMRAWLEILRERHPGVTWVAVENLEESASRDRQRQSASIDLAVAGDESYLDVVFEGFVQPQRVTRGRPAALKPS